jgi:hypothetical protein
LAAPEAAEHFVASELARPGEPQPTEPLTQMTPLALLAV